MSTSSQHVYRHNLQNLAEFRYILRRFLQFSEQACAQAGLQPQQHQMLLQIAGAPEDAETTIGYIAERLGLRHHSAVELSQRCEEAGLIARKHDTPDRRRVVLELTPAGQRALRTLSAAHARELYELKPVLISALTRISDHPAEESGSSSPASNRPMAEENRP